MLRTANNSDDDKPQEGAWGQPTLGHALDAWVSFDQDDKVVSWNPRAEELFGWPKAEALGARLSQLIIPQSDQRSYQTRLNQLIQNESDARLGHRFEATICRKSGALFLAEISVASIQEETGYLFHALIRDMSEQEMLRQREQTSKQRLLAQNQVMNLLAAANDFPSVAPKILGVLARGFEWDVAGLWSFAERNESHLVLTQVWNKEGMLGWEKFLSERQSLQLQRGQGLPGRAWQTGNSTWVSEISQDGDFLYGQSGASNPFRSGLWVPIQSGQKFYGVLELLSCKSYTYEEEVKWSLNALGGQLAQFIEKQVVLDQYRESEAILRRIFESNMVGLVFTSFSGQIVEANDLFLKMLGFDRKDLLAGRVNWRDLTPKEFEEASQRAVELLKTNGVCPPFEKEYLRKDGSRIPALIGSARISGHLAYDAVTFVLDISDRKKAEQAHQESENRFKSLFTKAPVPILIFSADGKTIAANEAWEKFFQASVTQLEDYNVLSDAQLKKIGVPKAFSRALAGETVMIPPSYYDPKVIGKPGRARWFELYLFPIMSNRSQVKEVGVFERDVTDEVQALETVKASEEHFRFLVDTSPALVWTSRENQKFDYFNRSWLEFTGCQVEQAIGMKWIERIYPEDRKRFLEAYEKATAQRTEFEIDYRLMRSDRSYRWVLNRAKPRYSVDGRFVGMIGSSIDISDRKRAEEILLENESRLQLLDAVGSTLSESLDYEQTLKRLTDLVVPRLADLCAVHIIESQSDVRRVALSYSNPETELWLNSMGENCPDQVDTTLYGPIKVIRTGSLEFISHGAELDLNPNSTAGLLTQVANQEGLCSYACVPLRARGKVIGAITLLTTRTSQRHFKARDLRLFEELAIRAGLSLDNAKLYRDAQIANRAKDEFLATLSHELRTPLNVIQGQAEILKDEGGSMLEDEIKSSAEAIFRNAKTQTRIISDLMDVSRIITGKMSFTPEPTDPAEAASSVIQPLKVTAQAKGIDLDYNFESAPSLIMVDPTRFQQILWNLVSNAIKYTHQRGRIWIRIFEEDSHSIIEVKDSGVGIDPDFLPHVFERFRQEDSSATRRFGGLGLGLSIVRYLAEMHGGFVTVESAGKNQGAKFRVILPLARSEITTEPQGLVP